MNFKKLFNKINSEVLKCRKSLKEAEEDFRIASKNTERFLSLCKKYGCKNVSIGMVHPKIEQSKKWNFTTNNVFGDGRHEHFPSIWRVVEDFGNGVGAGNTDQHQADISKLVDGIYELKNGRFFLTSEG